MDEIGGDGAAAPPAIGPAGAPNGSAPAPPIPPLAVSGLVATSAALVAALRLYVPRLVDVEILDGDRFLLVLAGDTSGDGRDQRKE